MYRLMIVEDEMIERMVLKKMLQKKFGEECQILEAQNGNEAVEIFKREEIQVVILDIGMPGMNGIQAAEIMRKEKRIAALFFLRLMTVLIMPKRRSPSEPWNIC